jgi:parvulin-like peptidyl-prolyl isomerase
MSADMPDTIPDDIRKENKKKLLDNLIDQKLLLQEAKKRKLKVTQRDLEGGLIQVRARFLPQEGQQVFQKIIERQMAGKGPEAKNEGPDLALAWKQMETDYPAHVRDAQSKFQEEMAKEGLTDKKFEDRIRDQLLTNQLTQSEVHSRMKPPTEDDLKALFDKVMTVLQGKTPQAQDDDLTELTRYFASQTGEKVRARHILIRVPKDASFKDKSAALKKVQDIRQQIENGADFEDMAKKYSDDKPSADKGGDLGVVSRGQTVPPFEKVAFELPVGKLSQPVETDFGYHLIQVEEKKASSKLRFEDAKEDLADFLMNTQGRKIVGELVEGLRKAAVIKITVDNLDEIGKK